MLLRYFGHSLFTVTLDSGTVILTDPYNKFCRYPRRETACRHCDHQPSPL